MLKLTGLPQFLAVCSTRSLTMAAEQMGVTQPALTQAIAKLERQLGVTLFELATGEVPFGSGEVAYHHRHTAVPDPQSVQPDIPDSLSELILRLLEKSPDDRLQTAADVLQALTVIEPEGFV